MKTVSGGRGDSAGDVLHRQVYPSATPLARYFTDPREVPAGWAGTSKALSRGQGVYVTVSCGRFDAVAFSPAKKPM